jgi:hypothetical protein
VGVIRLVPLLAVGAALAAVAVAAATLRRGAQQLAAEATELGQARERLDDLAEAAARLRDSGPPPTPR